MIETEQEISSKKYVTRIITHKGYRRIIKYDKNTKKTIKDETTFYKSHENPLCQCTQHEYGRYIGEPRNVKIDNLQGLRCFHCNSKEDIVFSRIFEQFACPKHYKEIDLP